MAVGGWIGVDFDGTLAEYHGWNDGKLGAPIPAMVARVKKWIADGNTVKIVTARAFDGTGNERDTDQCALVEKWCLEHIGKVLPITNRKDYAMIELWDDRAVAVEPNTGRVLGGGSRVAA